jgi:hypothetical protein
MASPVPVAFASLTGKEILQAYGVLPNGQPSGENFLLTTAQIAALASAEGSYTEIAVSVASGTTLTAAALIGGVVVRTGPSSAFSDTTDTAANIIASLPGSTGGYFVNIKNVTAYEQTLLAGLNVTLPQVATIAAFSISRYWVYNTSGTAVTFVHVNTSPIDTAQSIVSPTETAISTASGTTITAINFLTGLTSRTGPSAIFTDTTDTAANIIALLSNLNGKVGAAQIYTYINNSAYPATITGGSGTTVSGITVVAPNTTVDYLVTYTAANTLTMVGFRSASSTGIGVPVGGLATGTFSQASNTTLTSVTGMVASVVAGGQYAFEIYAAVTNAAGGGIKLGMNGGTATMTSFLADTFSYSTTTLEAETNITAISSPLVGSTTACTVVMSTGSFVVNAGGTVQVQAAQNASNTTATGVTNGSSLVLTRLA